MRRAYATLRLKQSYRQKFLDYYREAFMGDVPFLLLSVLPDPGAFYRMRRQGGAHVATTSLTSVGNSADSRGLAECCDILYCHAWIR
jgi:hypothetical protein